MPSSCFCSSTSSPPLPSTPPTHPRTLTPPEPQAVAEERAKCIVQFASFLQNNGLSLMRSMPELFTDVHGGTSPGSGRGGASMGVLAGSSPLHGSPPPAYAAASGGSAGFHAFTSQLAQQQQRQQGRGGPSGGAPAIFNEVDAWSGSGSTSATRHAVPAAVHGAATVQPLSSVLSSLAFPQASMGARSGASAPIPAKLKQQQQLQQLESSMAGLAGEHNTSTTGPK
jgi:hypothetical protein